MSEVVPLQTERNPVSAAPVDRTVRCVAALWMTTMQCLLLRAGPVLVAVASLGLSSARAQTSPRRNPTNPSATFPTKIVAMSPHPNAKQVALDRVVEIGFSRPIGQSSLSTRSIAITVDGKFLKYILSLEHGGHAVVARFSDFLPGSSQVVVEINGDRLLDENGSPVDADGDGRSGGITFFSFHTKRAIGPKKVDKSATVVGYVFDSDGNPLKDAVVEAFEVPRHDNDPPVNAPNAYSDATGYFEWQSPVFESVHSYIVRIRKDLYTESLRSVDLLAGRCTRVADSTLQAVTPPVFVSAQLGASLTDQKGQVMLVLPPGALQQDSYVGVTQLGSAAMLRQELPPLVAEQGTFTNVDGVFGDSTSVPVTLHVPNTYSLSVGTRIPFGKIDHNTLVWSDLRDLYQGPGSPPDSYLGTVKSDGAGGTFIEVQFDHFCSVCTSYCKPLTQPGAADSTPGTDPANDAGCNDAYTRDLIEGRNFAGRCLLVPDRYGCWKKSKWGKEGWGEDPFAAIMTIGFLLNDMGKSKCISGNSIVDVEEGALSESLPLLSKTEFGNVFDVRLNYMSATALPTRTLRLDLDPKSTRPIERAVFAFLIEGLDVEAAYGFSQNSVHQIGTYIWNGSNVAGEYLPTGSYPYTLRATTYNASTAVAVPAFFGGASVQQFSATYPGWTPLRATDVQGRATIVNFRDSPFGAGWSVGNVPRLWFDPDGCVVLTSGNANAVLYKPDPESPNRWIAGAGDITSLTLNPSTGTVTRTWPDGSRVEFDSNGLCSQQVDRFGAATVSTYTGRQLVALTSPTGFTYSFHYDAAGKLASIDDSSGRSTSFTVDVAGNLVSVTDPTGATRTFAYDADHLLVAQQGPRGEKTAYRYVRGRVVGVDTYDVDGVTLLRARTFAPTALAGEAQSNLDLGRGDLNNPIPPVLSRVSSYVDGTGGTTTYEVNAIGETTRVVDPLGMAMTYSYDANFNLLAIGHPDGTQTTFAYDDMRNVVKRSELKSDGTMYATTSFEYHPTFDTLTKSIDAEGRVSSYAYDSNGARTSTTDGGGKTTRWEYGDSRWPQSPTRVTLPNGSEHSMTYDAHGNLASSTSFSNPVANPAGETTTYVRDSLGRMTGVVDPDGLRTTTDYDGLDRPIKVTDPRLATFQFDYAPGRTEESSDLLVKVTYPSGESASFAYDGLGRLVSTTNRAGFARVLGYDPEGHVTSIRDRLDAVETFGYDRVGRLIRKVDPAAQVTTYTYDAMSHLIEARDAVTDLVYTYDRLGLPLTSTTSYTPSLGNTVSVALSTTLTATYDRSGRRLTLAESSGALSNIYTYDARGLLATVTDLSGAVFSLARDDAGWLTAIGRTGAAQSQLTWDFAGRVTSVMHGSSPPLALLYNSYSQGGRLLLTSEDVSGLNLVRTYAHDDVGAVTSANWSLSPTGSTVNVDPIYGAADRLHDDGLSTYDFDAESRTVRQLAKDGSVARDFEYDFEGRVVQIQEISDPLGAPVPIVTIAYRYDPLGRRIVKSVNGVETHFVSDGAAPVLELDAQNRAERIYVGADELPLALIDSVKAVEYAVLCDGGGTPIGLADATGALVQRWIFDDFGELLYSTKPSLTQMRSFAGLELDPESGFLFSGARLFAPRLGRFLGEDPGAAQSGSNGFLLFGNDPAALR